MTSHSDMGPLFETGEAYARRTDPATAQVAAAKVDATALEALVVGALREHGPMNVKEIALMVDRDKWSISPRLAPLVRKGLVRDSGIRRDGCIVWECV